jgi:hypothetical protein
LSPLPSDRKSVRSFNGLTYRPRVSATTVGAYRPGTVSAAPKAKVISCTLVVALLLGASRWGSYIGVPPLFLTDALIAASLLSRFLLPRGVSDRASVRDGFRVGAPGIAVAIVVYAMLRMLFSGPYFLTVTWLRDGAPYLYVVLAILSAHGMARATPATTKRTMKWVWRALIFHLGWVCLVGPLSAASALAQSRPLFSGGIFYGKPDTDSAILGITAGLLLRRLLMGQNRRWAIVGLVAVAYGASTFTNRAGFISLVLSCVVAFGFAYSATGRLSLKRIGLVLLVPVALGIAFVALPSTTVGARLLATVEPSHATSTAQENAVGTTEARQRTWKGVITWTEDDGSRMLWGAGMGVDFLEASGTLQYLEGTDYQNVRSPHDYFIGSFARLGLVGLGLIVIAVLGLFRRMISFRKRIAEDELLVFAALTVVSLLVVASLGVVLEAPFGAVPFWWAAGILFALARIKPTSA